MFGISVYLSDLDAADSACAAGHAQGFELLFSSLHIPEDDPSGYPALLRQLGSIARRNHLMLIADISGRSLGMLGLTGSSAGELRRWGVHGLRVDFGLDPGQIAELSRSLPVYLNASTLNEHDLDILIAAGVDPGAIETIHNYYPKPHTGLAAEFLAERNRMLHEKGIPVAGFVPGDGQLRAPRGQGLPTLEQHRGTHPLAAAVQLAGLGADHIFIGDPGLRQRTATQWTRYLRDRTVDLTLTLGGGELPHQIRARLEHTDHNRPDPGRDLIRLQASRPALGSTPIPQCTTAARPTGSVTVDNDLSGRYRGEITITTTDLPADPTVNVIGRITDLDLPLLNCIGPNQAVEFTIAG